MQCAALEISFSGFIQQRGSWLSSKVLQSFVTQAPRPPGSLPETLALWLVNSFTADAEPGAQSNSLIDRAR